jgi:hypothetical protein
MNSLEKQIKETIVNYQKINDKLLDIASKIITMREDKCWNISIDISDDMYTVTAWYEYELMHSDVGNGLIAFPLEYLWADYDFIKIEEDKYAVLKKQKEEAMAKKLESDRSIKEAKELAQYLRLKEKFDNVQNN